MKTIQDAISNPLPEELSKTPKFAGIIGGQPSKYAKSPTIWNPTFQALDIPALYVAFDVVEVAPPYDFAEVTTMAAAKLIIDLLSEIFPSRGDTES